MIDYSVTFTITGKDKINWCEVGYEAAQMIDVLKAVNKKEKKWRPETERLIKKWEDNFDRLEYEKHQTG